MILKQTTEGLTDGDKKEIIDKVNGNSGENGDNGDFGGDIPSMDNDNQMGNDPNMGGGEQPMMESINHRKLVNEIFQELTQKRDDSMNSIRPREIKNIGFRKKPFTAPQLR